MHLKTTSIDGDDPVELKFDAAAAEYEYYHYPIKPNGWWSIDEGASKNRVAIWGTAQPQLLAQGTRLQLRLDFDRNERVTNLGRFRLSISDDSHAFVRLAMPKIADPWAKLAAAYDVIGDQHHLAKLSRRTPKRRVPLAG